MTRDAESQEQETTAFLLGSLGTTRQDVQKISQETQRSGQGVQTAADESEASPQVKRCRGPLHPEGGAFLTLDNFQFHQGGSKRAGKPFTRCRRCEKLKRGRDPDLSGVIAMRHVMPLLNELERRIGRAETCRRAGVGARNFWWRIDRNEYPNVYMTTFLAIKRVYDDVMSVGEQRHPHDIRWGRTARGYAERRRRYQASMPSSASMEAAYLARNPVDLSEPDKAWWIDTGMEWLPRYGEEMLGADF